MKNRRIPYPTDLSDYQWEAIEDFFVNMRTYKWDKRELVNAALITKTGCQWRNLPHDFPPWKTVYSFFRCANISSSWNEILEFLIEITRQVEGKQPEPTYAIMDSQSVMTVGTSEQSGIDGGKKIKRVSPN